jgi:hypothetical protein
MTTRQQVFSFAKKNGIEIDVEVDPVFGMVHVHAYAPRDYVFAGSTCRNAGCGDYENKREINWSHVLIEVQLEHNPEAWADDPEEEGTMFYWAIFNKHDLSTVLHFTAKNQDEAIQYLADYIAEDPETRQDLDVAFDATKDAEEAIRRVYAMAGTAD